MDLELKKNKKLINLAGSLAAIGVISLAVYLAAGLSRVSTDDAYVTGRVHSIAPKISGSIKMVHIADNQIVKKGDLLIEIDPVDYELKANEAGATHELQKANFEQASRDKDRAVNLYNDKVFAKERYEKTVTLYDLANAQQKAAGEHFKIAKQNLEYTKIYSPSDGYVTNKSVEEGNQVQPGQPLMAIVALNDIWVVANYKETQLKNVRPGQPARIKVDTYPGKVFNGKVDSIMAGTGAAFSLFPPENALGNYVKVVQRIPVKIVFDNSADEKHTLRIGMSCVPTIITKK